MKNKNILPILSVICVIAVAVMLLTLTFGGNKTEQPEFLPPAFDINAQSGMPEVSDKSWSKIFQDGMSFTAYVCGKVEVTDGKADIYFTNDNGNAVWLKLRITDEKGNVLGQTGLIKPGEYVKSVVFDSLPKNGIKIKLKIMAYEPDTYYSAGAVTLNTTVGVK